MTHIIGIVGFLNAGKDTAASALIEQGYKKDSFASPLKDATSSIFCWDRALLEGDTTESRKWREEKDDYWSEKLGYAVTPRAILQNLGTEVFRNSFSKSIWVDSLLYRVKKNNKTVITDCRFPNEIDAIRKAGGLIIRIKRGSEPSWYHLGVDAMTKPADSGGRLAIQELANLGVHASEYSWLGSELDFVIENNGSIDELKERIRGLNL
jgi:hypothetical protein